MWFAGQDNRTTLQKPVWNIFLPRVGFAWSPSMFRNTTVRGGYGMYSYNFSEDTYGNGLGAGSINTSQGNYADPNDGGGPPALFLSSSAATAAPLLNYVVGSPAARQPLTYFKTPPRGVTYTPYRVPVGRINEWTLSVEHQFAHDYVASVAYVGSHGYNLQFPTDLNQVLDPAGMALSAGGGNNQSFRPFPLFAGIGGNNYNAISNYDALQTAVQKRYSNGLTFEFNYVWSHFLDEQDSSGWGSRGGTQRWQVGNNPRLNYADSNFDIPHAFKGIVSYELPFGRGKTYFHGNALTDAVVGGWRISGTFIKQSGNPFTVFDGQNLSGSRAGTWYLDKVSDPFSSVPALPAGTQGISYFNKAAFTPAPIGTFGTNGRNTLRGPGLTVLNLSLAKEFHFRERYGLQLRADFVNALNHPSFQPPQGDFSQGNFGHIDSSLTAGGTTVAPRSGQLSARFSF